ncbi:MAG: protein-disulfide reductase DsbD [Cycloclasticus sp.]|jgi:thiol:disulfide interchange protein DsbD|nr:protein-disulfide reductase DsbD [Cycloclasticus sp.]
MHKIRLASILINLCVLFLAPTSLSIAESKSITTTPIDALGSLFSGFNNSPSNELLEPDDAFNFFAEVNNDQQLVLNWRIAKGYYLYQEKIAATVIQPNTISVGPISFPEGKHKTDEIFGETIVYYNDVTLTVPFATPLKQATDITIDVSFQGCADIGVCYPPMNKQVTLSFQPTKGSIPPTTSANNTISEQDQIANSLFSNTVWITCLTFLGFGVLLSFTPCVFPMIPILSGIIIGHGKDLTTRKAFYLSFSYVFASALTYAGFGILAGLFGSNLQATFQNPWILSFFSGLFVLLALSMFGLYQIQLPTTIQSKLSQLSQHQKHGSLWGSAIMGVLSTLIVGPCVAAPLAGVLIYIGQTGDAILGGFALFSLGIGMGIPLLIIGVSAGKLLPKAGHWMEPIKYFFGVMLLAVAIWLVERILPASIILVLWSGLLIVSAIYLKAVERLPENANGWHKLSKGIGAILLIYGIILMVGAASGGSNPLKPLANFSTNQKHTVQQHPLSFKKIKNSADLNSALQLAAQNKQFAMLDFYADWCVSCKEMEAFTFTDSSVQGALKNVMLLQADVTQNDNEDRLLLNKFSLIGPPAILFFDTNSTELKQNRVIGYMGPNDFLTRLKTLK